MLLKEIPGNNYLIGAVDEISSYNYNIEYLGGWYKKEIISNKNCSPRLNGNVIEKSNIQIPAASQLPKSPGSGMKAF